MGYATLVRAATTAKFFVLASIVPAALSAQAVIRGVLYDDGNGSPVRGTVMLVDPATDAAVVHVVTDSAGQFTLQVHRGSYQIAAVRPGYNSVLSAPVPLQDGERLTIRLPIAVEGDPVHQIGVTEHVRPGAKEGPGREAGQRAMSAYEGRRATGTGLHFDRDRLAQSSYHTIGEFLQSVPGLNVADPSSGSSMQMTRSAAMMNLTSQSSAACHIGWFIDGHRMDLPGRADPLTAGIGSMSLESIEAVEVFRGLSEMPAEYAAPDLRCGAIALWTRR